MIQLRNMVWLGDNLPQEMRHCGYFPGNGYGASSHAVLGAGKACIAHE